MSSRLISDIIDYWFLPPGQPGHGSNRAVWFDSTPAIDAEIRLRFGTVIERAVAGRLDHLARSPRGALALCLLLDQMTRNAFRGTGGAFAGDRRARRIAGLAVQRGFDRRLPVFQRSFLYLPFHHSESRGDQNRCIGLMWSLRRPVGLKFAVGHRDIVVRFGRFPHRNAALSRNNSPDEETWLRRPHARFGQ